MAGKWALSKPER